MKAQRFFRILAILLMLAGSVSSCSKKEPVCNVNNPLTDLPWLKEFIHGSEQMPGMLRSISQCTYNNGIDGFLIVPCANCDSYLIVLCSCDGSVLQEAETGISRETLVKEWNVKDIKTIWENH
jgi:hypothetical protein